jgi:hypothetical protein
MANRKLAASLIGSWKAGALTNSEFAGRYVGCIDSANAAEAFAALPQELREAVRDAISEAPTTEVGWGRMMITESNCGGTETLDETERRHARQLQEYRVGVEALRAWLEQEE